MNNQDYEQALERALLSQPHSNRVVVDSPPGAGKTGVVEHVSVQAVMRYGERVMIAAQTRSQCLDLATRISAKWLAPVYLLWPKSEDVPEASVDVVEDAQQTPQSPFFRLVRSPKELPDTPHITIATSAKWIASSIEDGWYDLQIVEEAYQLTDTDWRLFSSMAKRHFLVGDPGQIAPVVSIETIEWEASEEPPHYPAPENLLRRFPGSLTTYIQLPASRRLPGYSAHFVSELLYPTLNFWPTSDFPDRRIQTSSHDPLLQKIQQGASLVATESIQPIQTIVETIKLCCQSHLVDKDILIDRNVLTSDIGIVCTRTKDVQALQAACAKQGWTDIYCETAERFQGLEREIIFVLHPLWDSENVEFGLLPGKWCVMLSRHRVACIIVAPVHSQEMLAELSTSEEKRFYSQDQTEKGVEVHKETIQRLKKENLWINL